jgi:hypothetical protein
VQPSQRKPTHFCWICGHPVDLETCTTDEHGMAVHADCYAVKAALAKQSKPLMVRKPAHRITALWYLMSGPGARSSAR